MEEVVLLVGADLGPTVVVVRRQRKSGSHDGNDGRCHDLGVDDGSGHGRRHDLGVDDGSGHGRHDLDIDDGSSHSQHDLSVDDGSDDTETATALEVESAETGETALHGDCGGDCGGDSVW
jgi:hypothetical protein